MKLLSLILFVASGVLFAQEVSVFGAGDLESPAPYGLTSFEKVTLKNKNNLNKFDRKIDDTRSNLEILSERIEGLESIVDGDSRKLNSNVLKLNKVSQDVKIQNSSLEETKDATLYNTNNIEELKNNFEEYSKIQNDNIELLQNKIDELTVLLNNINKNYVSKKRFDELVTFINKQSSKKSKKISSKRKKQFDKPKKELLADAKALFKKDYFTNAIPIFTYLIEKKYRPAESNFYLGEIWFHRKKYKDAIHHFKTSMILYDKAKYIPKLLLHSAISFEKINDLDNAANFYGTLIDVYPETKEAKKAQRNLANTN